MNDRRYRQFVRLLAVIAAIAMWLVSIEFSQRGFSFNVQGFNAIGYGLAVVVTILELVFDEEGMKHSLTLAAVGILAYAYGVVTNVQGIWAAQGAHSLVDDPMGILFPIVLGILLEITPEPLFLWGMGLSAAGVRDFLGHLVGMFDDRPQQSQKGQQQQQQPKQQQPHCDQHQRQDNGWRDQQRPDAARRFERLVRGK